MLLDDAGISYEYSRVLFNDWTATKQKTIDNGKRIHTLPVLVTKSGKFYGTTAPILRLISKKLNKYIPKDPEDEYLADAYSDIYLDWMTKWMEVFFIRRDPKVTQEYEVAYRVAQHKNWNNILGDRKGPYILGDEVCN